MATLYTQQGANIRKTWFLMGVFFALIVAIGYFLSWYYGNSLMLYIAITFAFIMNVGSYWFSDKIVLSTTGARPVTREEFFDYWNSVENLSIAAGLPMPKVYVIDDPSPNAFATGRDKEHAVVCATTGLLGMMSKIELEGVISHELSHIGNRDMLVMTVAVVLAGSIAMLADFFMRSIMWGGGRDNDRDRSPLVLILGIIGIILAPIAAQLIQLAISRKREFLADASGALLTRYPEGLASALEKISAYGMPMRKVSNATAHLFIADPHGSIQKQSFTERLGNLFSTHPPAVDRIRALRGMEV